MKFRNVLLVASAIFFCQFANSDAYADRTRQFNSAPEFFKLLKSGEEAKAVDVLTANIKSNPCPSNYRNRADIELTLHRNKEALADAIKACKLNSKDVENIRVRGKAYDAVGNTTAAAQDYTLCVQLSPRNHVFRLDRARFYVSHGEFKSAIADFNIAIETTEKQNRSKLYEARGKCFMKIGDYKAAVADFSGALDEAYGRSELFRLRAESYKKLGQLKQAADDLRSASEMDEDFKPPAHLGNEH